MILLLALAAITARPEVSKDLEARGMIAYAAGRCNTRIYAKDQNYLTLVTRNLTSFQEGYMSSLYKHGIADSKTEPKIDPKDCAATLHDAVRNWINLK